MPRFFTLRAAVGGLLVLMLALGFGRLFLDMAAASTLNASQELLKKWERYARKIQLPQDQISDDAEEAVSLMNAHRGRALPDRPVRFTLWRPGQPAPPGYVINPQPFDWENRDAQTTFTRTRKHVPNNLSQQTDAWLYDYGYICRLIDGDVHVFRQGAFLPHLVTKTFRYDEHRPGDIGIFFRAPAHDAASRLSAWLETGGVYMGPGAQVAVSGHQFTLRLDDGSMALATRLFGSSAVEISRGKELRVKLRTWLQDQEERWLGPRRTVVFY